MPIDTLFAVPQDQVLVEGLKDPGMQPMGNHLYALFAGMDALLRVHDMRYREVFLAHALNEVHRMLIMGFDGKTNIAGVQTRRMVREVEGVMLPYACVEPHLLDLVKQDWAGDVDVLALLDDWKVYADESSQPYKRMHCLRKFDQTPEVFPTLDADRTNWWNGVWAVWLPLCRRGLSLLQTRMSTLSTSGAHAWMSPCNLSIAEFAPAGEEAKAESTAADAAIVAAGLSHLGEHASALMHDLGLLYKVKPDFVCRTGSFGHAVRMVIQEAYRMFMQIPEDDEKKSIKVKSAAVKLGGILTETGQSELGSLVTQFEAAVNHHTHLRPELIDVSASAGFITAFPTTLRAIEMLMGSASRIGEMFDQLISYVLDASHDFDGRLEVWKRLMRWPLFHADILQHHWARMPVGAEWIDPLFALIDEESKESVNLVGSSPFSKTNPVPSTSRQRRYMKYAMHMLRANPGSNKLKKGMQKRHAMRVGKPHDNKGFARLAFPKHEQLWSQNERLWLVLLCTLDTSGPKGGEHAALRYMRSCYSKGDQNSYRCAILQALERDVFPYLKRHELYSKMGALLPAILELYLTQPGKRYDNGFYDMWNPCLDSVGLLPLYRKDFIRYPADLCWTMLKVLGPRDTEAPGSQQSTDAGAVPAAPVPHVNLLQYGWLTPSPKLEEPDQAMVLRWCATMLCRGLCDALVRQEQNPTDRQQAHIDDALAKLLAWQAGENWQKTLAWAVIAQLLNPLDWRSPSTTTAEERASWSTERDRRTAFAFSCTDWDALSAFTMLDNCTDETMLLPFLDLKLLLEQLDQCQADSMLSPEQVEIVADINGRIHGLKALEMPKSHCLFVDTSRSDKAKRFIRQRKAWREQLEREGLITLPDTLMGPGDETPEMLKSLVMKFASSLSHSMASLSSATQPWHQYAVIAGFAQAFKQRRPYWKNPESVNINLSAISVWVHEIEEAIIKSADAGQIGAWIKHSTQWYTQLAFLASQTWAEEVRSLVADSLLTFLNRMAEYYGEAWYDEGLEQALLKLYGGRESRQLFVAQPQLIAMLQHLLTVTTRPRPIDMNGYFAWGQQLGRFARLRMAQAPEAAGAGAGGEAVFDLCAHESWAPMSSTLSDPQRCCLLMGFAKSHAFQLVRFPATAAAWVKHESEPVVKELCYAKEKEHSGYMQVWLTLQSMIKQFLQGPEEARLGLLLHIEHRLSMPVGIQWKQLLHVFKVKALVEHHEDCGVPEQLADRLVLVNLEDASSVGGSRNDGDFYFWDEINLAHEQVNHAFHHFVNLVLTKLNDNTGTGLDRDEADHLIVSTLGWALPAGYGEVWLDHVTAAQGRLQDAGTLEEDDLESFAELCFKVCQQHLNWRNVASIEAKVNNIFGQLNPYDVSPTLSDKYAELSQAIKQERIRAQGANGIGSLLGLRWRSRNRTGSSTAGTSAAASTQSQIKP